MTEIVHQIHQPKLSAWDKLDKQIEKENAHGKENLAASKKFADEVLEQTSTTKPSKDKMLTLYHSAGYLMHENKLADAEKLFEAGLKVCSDKAKPTWLEELAVSEGRQGKYKEAYGHVLEKKNIDQSNYDKHDSFAALMELSGDYARLGQLANLMNSPQLAKEFTAKSSKYSDLFKKELTQSLESITELATRQRKPTQSLDLLELILRNQRQ